MPFRVKRAYESPASTDGMRVLVDRLWPRGLTKKNLHFDSWLKDLGPSDVLRRWFGHDPKRFLEFRRRYFEELRDKESLYRGLLARARRGPVTLLYSARDEEHNQAVVLKAFLDRRLRSTRKK